VSHNAGCYKAKVVKLKPKAEGVGFSWLWIVDAIAQTYVIGLTKESIKRKIKEERR